jgi:hypothetical protein
MQCQVDLACDVPQPMTSSVGNIVSWCNSSTIVYCKKGYVVLHFKENRLNQIKDLFHHLMEHRALTAGSIWLQVQP